MSVSNREQLLVETLVSTVDTLVDDFDVIDFLQDLVDRCAEIFDAADVGIVLADPDEQPVVLASTSERVRLIEVLQLTADGPYVDSRDAGEAITAGSLDAMRREWPEFSAEAGKAGYRSVHVVPLRLHKTIIGSLTLFSARPEKLTPTDASAVQTIADLATIGLVQKRSITASTATQEELRHVLTARALVEQAKGILARSRSTDTDGGWRILRQYAHNQHTSVTDVAQAFIDGRTEL